jgi:hypothetical protein
VAWLDLVYGKEEIQTESEEVAEEELLWRYITVLDERVCPNCGPLEGEVFPESVLEETFPDLEVLAEGVIHPHVHIGCRCQLIMEQPTEEYPIWGVNTMEGGESLETEVMKYNEWAGGFF